MQAQKNDMSGPAALSKEKKRSSKRSMKPDHPRYKEMIAAALKDLRKPRGASRQAISKFISSNYTVGSSSNHHLSTALKSMVSDKSLVITKGVGAAGSYKVNRETSAAKKSSLKKATKGKKKPASKKVVKKRRNATAKVGSKKVNVKKGKKTIAKKSYARSGTKVKKSVPKVNKRGRKK